MPTMLPVSIPDTYERARRAYLRQHDEIVALRVEVARERAVKAALVLAAVQRATKLDP